MKNMTTKKIDKIIIYYNDGTFEEVKTGVHDVAPKQDTGPTITIGKQNVNTYPPQWPPLQYPPGVRGVDHPWTYGNVTCSDTLGNKYTIATNSNGNVDFSNNIGREFT
jgi:hypothetical protein